MPNMDCHTKDALANSFSISAVFSFLLSWQAELTILLLVTGLLLNFLRIYDRLKNGKSKD